MNESVELLGKKFDAEQILKELLPITERSAHFDSTFGFYLQLSLTHSKNQELPDWRWFDGVGSLYNDVRKTITPTSIFSTLNEELIGTYTESVINSVWENAKEDGVKIGRIRLMQMNPKTCYTLHIDPEEFRYHIPLYTNDKCFFVIGDSIFRMTNTGRLYRFKTNERHTAVNASMDKRLHLVFDTYK